MKERKVKIILRWLIPLLCAVFVIVIMFLKFSIDIREDAINTVEKEIEETTEKYALRIANDLQSICASGKTTAQVIGQYTSKDMKIIQQLLEAVVDQTQIYEAVYCDENGTFINHDGEYITLPSQPDPVISGNGNPGLGCAHGDKQSELEVYQCTKAVHFYRRIH